MTINCEKYLERFPNGQAKHWVYRLYDEDVDEVTKEYVSVYNHEKEKELDALPDFTAAIQQKLVSKKLLLRACKREERNNRLCEQARFTQMFREYLADPPRGKLLMMPCVCTDEKVILLRVEHDTYGGGTKSGKGDRDLWYIVGEDGNLRISKREALRPNRLALDILAGRMAVTCALSNDLEFTLDKFFPYKEKPIEKTTPHALKKIFECPQEQYVNQMLALAILRGKMCEEHPEASLQDITKMMVEKYGDDLTKHYKYK